MCLTISGATYASVEYHGLEWLPLNDRQTLASMAVELGAKCGIVPPLGVVARRFEVPDWLFIDPHASYTGRLQIDLDTLERRVLGKAVAQTGEKRFIASLGCDF